MVIPRKLILAFTALSLVATPLSAEEAAQPLLTALTGTTITGYVDVSDHWNPGVGHPMPVPPLEFVILTEILWQHSDGRVAAWLMSGTNLVYSRRILPPASPLPAPLEPALIDRGNV